MPSDFDAIAQNAALVIENLMAEKDDMGNFVPLEYSPPGRPPDYPKFEWPAILSDERFEPVYDADTGETSLRVIVTADVRTEYVLYDEITQFQMDAVITVGGYDWTMYEAESHWDPAFVTFGLQRVPLMRGNELRRAPV